MPPKRANERLDSSEKSEKAVKRQKQTCGEVVNPSDDLEKDSTQNLSSLQSKKELLSLSTTMEQLEKYVRAGNEDAARELITHQAINLKTSEVGDLLWTAYALGMKEIAIMLVRHGADLSVRKHLDNRTLLHHMLRGSHIKSATTRKLFYSMLDHGADVNACDNEGRSPLYYAIRSCHEGSMKLAEELLKRGALVKVNRGTCLKAEIYLACKHKIEFLPKLIHHRGPGSQINHDSLQRATLAMNCLVSEKCKDNEGAAALLMIKKLLGLGVRVNILDRPRGKRKMSILDRALSQKNIALIALLLKYGADPHRPNHMGHTTLYQATAFKDSTQVSRWFIERGVSIEAQNFDEDYPIHGACKHRSPENLHLLWNLGANLNVTNRFGKTPFGMMNMSKKKQKPVQQLVIKYLALQMARGEQIFEKDMFKINEHDWSKFYFRNCLKQLEKMKALKVHSASYFSLLSKSVNITMQLMKDQSFIKGFQRDEKRRARLFPDYYDMLLHSFKIATRRLEVFLEKQEFLRKAFMGILPDSVLEKLAYYLCLKELKHCNYEYFMTLHEKHENRLN